MLENEKSSSIVSLYSSLLLEVWKRWDVRGMVLFSLILQIILSVLGRHRKYKINFFFKAILWFAYLSADWIAIVTLGKLSSSYVESTATNVFRAYWAPLLLVHLGGPDTITAYAFEDNKLWIRHLVILVVKVILVIYVVCLSWTFSWLSFFSLPLILAGIIKYVEKILCLKLNNSQKTKPIISSKLNLRGHSLFDENQTLKGLHKENPNVLSGYLLFTIMRPDVNDYLSSHNLCDVETRIQTYLQETANTEVKRVTPVVGQYMFGANRTNVYETLSIELGFMFDVVYTKASLIYTKLGCFLRLTSFTSSLSVLLLFFINIINEQKFHGRRIDIAITGILLSGAIAQELYAAWVMLSSDWAALVAEFHHNVLVRKIFKVISKYFPCLLHQSKRWSNRIGQFDLLEYCWRHKKRPANQSHWFLLEIITGGEIVEMWHKYRFTKFVESSFFTKSKLLGGLWGTIERERNVELEIKPARVWQHCQEFVMQNRHQFKQYELIDQLKWSIELELDHIIIIWHLATSVCYLQENNLDGEAMKISKQISDYMMYLLVMCPALLLSEHSKSFWLDHAYDNLKELMSPEIDINAASTLLSNSNNVHGGELESRERTFEKLKREVVDLVTFLKPLGNKWEKIMDVWMMILVYAAVSSQHINHVKQLGEGIEFLSHLWLFVINCRCTSGTSFPMYFIRDAVRNY